MTTAHHTDSMHLDDTATAVATRWAGNRPRTGRRDHLPPHRHPTGLSRSAMTRNAAIAATAQTSTAGETSTP